MANFNFQHPDKFDFQKQEQWEKWLKRFERFRLASGLGEKDEEVQVNTLIYSMGPEAEEIMSSFNLSNENSKKYDTVVEKLNQHFIPKKNVIFERAKFNQRSQMAGESVDSFITELYHLAENCELRDLHDSLIRDRIVVGIRDHKLSERLQLDPTLSLEKAVTEAKQRESVRAQQAVVRGEPSSTVEVVTRRQHKTQGHRNWKPEKTPVPSTPASRDCQRCGNTPGHPRNKCPAKDAKCRKCQKVGHFQKKCRSTVGAVNEASNTEHSDEDESFLSTVRDQRPRTRGK
ncbi:uncharacterized protein LOC128215919 [Mya arenaria]|uniref:uncharacterized protein LOC128215919 n=1 Tax=Mya arenaria TaxID=6604 RepID=UPI0022E2B3CE|nr:uncharacterized protein LOC128215919 [Mya arenaria]